MFCVSFRATPAICRGAAFPATFCRIECTARVGCEEKVGARVGEALQALGRFGSPRRFTPGLRSGRLSILLRRPFINYHRPRSEVLGSARSRRVIFVLGWRESERRERATLLPYLFPGRPSLVSRNALRHEQMRRVRSVRRDASKSRFSPSPLYQPFDLRHFAFLYRALAGR